LFNAKGYTAATTAEIAREAGISEPTMYKHFKNKKELFLACFGSITEELLSSYREVYKNTLDDEIGYLKGVIKIYFDFVTENPHKSMFLVHLLSYRNDPDFKNTFTDFMDRCIEGVRRVLISAKKKGRLKSDVDVHILAGIFVNQYFTVVSLREFIEPEYFTNEMLFWLMRDMLVLEER
jgi:AcrR family transcriptional regulator